MNLPPSSDGQRNRNKARIRKHGITYRMIDTNENERARDFVVALAGMRWCSTVRFCFPWASIGQSEAAYVPAGAWAPAMPPGA